MVSVEQVKKYWEENTPQYWYSNKEEGSKEYYDDIQRVRYSEVYTYLPKLAEFDKHAGKKVLEIGCGQGTDLLQYAKSGSKVFGTDLTEAAIKKTKQMFLVYGIDADLRVCNAEDLKCFEDNSFDIVYSFGVIHHTPETQKCIDDIRRVLKPGGKAFVMIYAKGLNYLFKLFYNHILQGGFLKYSLVETISGHSEYKRKCPLTKMYSKRQARKMFSAFKNVKIRKKHNPQFRDILPLPIFKMMPKHLYEIFQRIFGDNLMISCEK